MGWWIAVMLDRVGEWTTAVDLTGPVSLPGWIVAVVAALVVAACIFESIRRDPFRRSGPLMGAAVVLVVVLMGWWAIDHLARRDLAAERRALDVHTFELATRALMPGSALACLDAVAGETVEDACEKALFASPEATAAAVSYVAAQLSLLARDQARRAGTSPGIAALRRAVETDRFGIVAQVLTVRDRCTPDQCSAFFLLEDASRIRANLADQTFESQVKRHMANWPAAESRPVAANPSSAAPSPAPVASTRTPNNLYFPSSASIPPVNIMTAEPPAQRQHDTTGAAETPTPPRKPAQAAAPAPRPAPAPAANAPPARTAPIQLAPNPQWIDPSEDNSGWRCRSARGPL
jgi:hypothetical protein